MPKYFKNKNTKYVKHYNLVGGDIVYAKTENMYIDYDNGGVWLESFPGYRRVNSFSGRINGIYDMDLGDKGFLVHAGERLYSCRFIDKYRESSQVSIICDANDKKSFAYRLGENILFFDGADIAVIDRNLSTKKLTLNPSAIYVPTTYIDEEEVEQVNMLTDKFKEEFHTIKTSDLAYESDGLIYRVKSEADLTCSVAGVRDDGATTLEIPNRKRINGRYYKVVEVADYAFYNNTSIKDVILGCDVGRVGKRAFSGCKNLKLAVMPEGIREIDELAFAGCSSLQNVYIGVSCKSIYYNSFNDCPSNMNVYFSDTYEHLEKCEGVGNLMEFSVFYSTKRPIRKLSVPISTPAKSITSVMVNDKEVSYTTSLDRGLITISVDNVEELEGNNIYISGKVDGEKIRISERGTTFSAFSKGADAMAAILSCTGGECYDGRGFIFGAPDFKNVVFMSSYTKDGFAHPLYFGDLDYITVGSAVYSIRDVKREGGRLAIAKPDEGGGSIYLLYPKGEEGAAFGRKYPVIYILRDTGVRSALYEFNSSTIFVGKGDIYRMKYSSSSAVASPISLRCPDEMKRNMSENMIFTNIGGYLAAIFGTDMYLGDKRITFEVAGDDQYKWFPIKNLGSYEGERRDYFYAKSDTTGIYTHPDVGKVATGEIYSYIDEDRNTIYYVNIGIRKYRVIPGEEATGEVTHGISHAQRYGDTIIFGTDKGDIFAFNTDKKGIPPTYVYTSGYYNDTSFSTSYKNRIHPYFYTNAGHRIKYSLTTAPYNGEMGHIMKCNVRGALTAKLEIRAAANICFSTSTDRRAAGDLGQIAVGDTAFWDMKFDNISFSNISPEIVSIPENHEKWVEKQITIYTDQLKAPFAVNSISLGFKVGGQIKNGQDK